MKTEEYEEFYCDCCKTFTKILKTTLKKRKYEKNKKFCVECYSKIVPKHGPKKIDFYPEEIRDIINLDVLPYERVMEVKDVLKTKKKVSFKCKICESESVISFVNMKTRKYAKFEPICQKCILKYVTGTDEWKRINSEAQFIAQNRFDVIEKQRKAQRRLIREDRLYIDKRRSNSFISGSICDIYFDSSWELFYIIYCFESKEIKSIERNRKRLSYKDKKGKTRYYIPDFLVTYENGDKYIVEIKGNLCRNVDEKINAAESKFGSRYKMYRQSDLHKIGLRVRSEPFLKDWYKKAFKDYNVKINENECYFRWKERIDKWINE